ATAAFIISSQVIAQPWKTTGNNLIGGEILGSLSGPFPLTIQTAPAQAINFLTNSTQRMTILGTNGFVGIGTGLTTPVWQLDVNDNSNLNINYNTTGAGFGYRINGDKLLSNPGISNTFVGKNAGAAWVFPGPGLFQQCTFVGEDAGPVSTGEGCTFVGTQSGVCRQSNLN
ncbi:MAG TPA: hypothetical protein VNW06_09095, partial [Cytophagaceae bacterium]|nr:hypothetical protein [Cytophagaceae bacterium]